MPKKQTPAPAVPAGLNARESGKRPVSSRHSIAAYDEAMGRFLKETNKGLLAMNPVLGPMRSSETSHAGPTRNLTAPTPVDQPHVEIGAAITVNLLDLKNGDIDSYIQSVCEFCYEMQKGSTKHAFQAIDEISEVAGTKENLHGRKITSKDIIRLIDSVQGGFDKECNPNPISIFAAPDTAEMIAQLEWTAEDQEKLDLVYKKKKEDCLASKRTRRLGRIGN